MKELILPVKQGEELNIGFTIKAGDRPMDLSTYTVKFQVKEVPLEKSEPLIDKTITLTSDMNEDGLITYPDQGQFVVHLKKEDTSLHTGDFSLIIAIQGPNYYDIISSKSYNKATYRVCEQ